MRPQAFNYILEKESANDQAATIVKLCAASGSMIREGDHVLDIETSKAVQEVHSPWTGMVVHGLTVGDEPSFGSVLFSVLAEGASLTTDELVPPARVADDPPLPSRASEPAPGISGPRISPRAADLARELGVDTSALKGGFITVDDIRRAARGGMTATVMTTAATTDAVAPPAPPAAIPSASAIPGLPGETVALTPRKRQEIRTLTQGAGATALSVLGAAIGAMPQRLGGGGSAFFADAILDLVTYEASRLMRKFRNLNAAYVGNDTIYRYDAVHAGIAFDDGNRLTVYTVRDADGLDLVELQNRILLGLDKYIGKELTADDTTLATFTVTDLSSMNVDFVWPILPAGQSCIIAIARSPALGYGLYVGFDHRATEGREVAAFLGELCARLHTYALADAAAEPECTFCGKTLEEEMQISGGRGFVKLQTREREDALCCFSCLSGV